MELSTVNEVTLYGVRIMELVEEPGKISLTLVPKILPDDALLNKPVQEIERMALEEAEKTSPSYQRGKEVKRKGYASYRFLKGFGIVMDERETKYELEWISVKLPVLYGEGRVRTQVEETLLREERKVFASLMLVYSVKGGKLNAKLWMPEIETGGDFNYVIVDGKYVKLKGRKAVLLVAMGVTREGNRAVLELIISEAEDAIYWSLLVRVWKKTSFVLVVADGIKALDRAISLAELHVGRQGCLVHLKRTTKEEREALDAITSSAELGKIMAETNPSKLPHRRQEALEVAKVQQPGRVLQLPPREEVRVVSLSLEDTTARAGHSPLLQPIGLFSRYRTNITIIFILLTFIKIYQIICTLDKSNLKPENTIRNGLLSRPSTSPQSTSNGVLYIL
ncbi:hypothetical protein IC007_0596 [Sulfuracidifex tepidarius]|uniref:Uncharacterized protein n=1 Tax=Sulfuracidifex tepidarius TaxID=1294262 RepID=A0A510E0R5_9CREN|nr:hypothetical protein IC007_0596 [Sulfuracidifex tepidarius]